MLAVVYWHCVASHRSKGCNYTMVEAWNLANKILFLSCIQYICKFFTFTIFRCFIPVVLLVTYIFCSTQSYTKKVNIFKIYLGNKFRFDINSYQAFSFKNFQKKL
jgi:hypothetical protein